MESKGGEGDRQAGRQGARKKRKGEGGRERERGGESISTDLEGWCGSSDSE